MKNLFLVTMCSLGLLVSPNLLAKTINKVTVTVKNLEGSESGDGYSIIATNGKEYYVYNAGGSESIKGENYVKEGAKICLTLGADMGDVKSVSKGKCK